MFFVLRYACVPTATRASSFFFPLFLEMLLFPSFLYNPLCMESTSHVPPFQIKCFSTRGWIFYISLRENYIKSINQYVFPWRFSYVFFLLFCFVFIFLLTSLNPRPFIQKFCLNPTMSSCPLEPMFPLEYLKKKLHIMPNKWRTIISLVHKIRYTSTVDEGKERLNPSREKHKGKHRRRKVDEKPCVTRLVRPRV